MFEISVIICTYNRADILGETLRSWVAVNQAGPGVELLVVDNNSTDHTRQVVDSFGPRCPNPLRYVCEPRVGLSHARNKGIAEARGAILAFVDDDVDFTTDWLDELVTAFSKHPEIACVGGNSIPKFEIPRPDWLIEDNYRFYGSTCSGSRDRPMRFPEHPFGLNMAFRKGVFSQVGPFNTALGRIKNSLLSNEEAELFYRVEKAGLKVFYASKALLYHRIPADRLNKDWIIERTYWQGISRVAYWQIINPSSKPALMVKTLKISKKLIGYAIRKILSDLFPAVRPHSFSQQLSAYRALGIARQSLLEIVPLLKRYG